jgi:hypothetical protein
MADLGHAISPRFARAASAKNRAAKRPKGDISPSDAARSGTQSGAVKPRPQAAPEGRGATRSPKGEHGERG